MNYDNDQCEIVEHQINKPELFHDSYPYERFETDQLPNLEKESLKFYKNQLKFAENDKPLAYYFFEYRNLSKNVKAGIRSIYKQYKEKYELFEFNNLKNNFSNLDITNSMTNSSLFKKVGKNEMISNLFIWNKERRVSKDKILK